MAWCRERLLVPGQALSASLAFAPAADQGPILAIRSVVAELHEAASAHSDPGLVAARLGWWRTALDGQADHPALSALSQSGAAARLPDCAFVGLLDGLAREQQGLRFERYEEMWELCRATGGQAALVEFRLHDVAPNADCPALDLGAAAAALRIARDLVVDARAGRWLVPLDLQAQFQVGRVDALAEQVGPGWDGLVRTLVERALRSGEAAARRMPLPHRHLLIHWAVDRRLARALISRPRAVLQRRLLPGHAGNVWTAWRTARRLERVSGQGG